MANNNGAPSEGRSARFRGRGRNKQRTAPRVTTEPGSDATESGVRRLGRRQGRDNGFRKK